MRRKEALAAGAMFFTGKVCNRHPELLGRRRTKSGSCPECIRERMSQSRRESAATREREAKYLKKRSAALKAGTWSPRKYRRANEKASVASAG